MSMGTTRDDGSQQSLLVSAADLPRGAGHPFYERLNRILETAGFDAFVEKVCARFYTTMGRPSLAPGRYFRLLLLGYFEGLDSERAIAWRASDSLSVRAFLRLALPASPPDHSTISRTRRLFSVEAHQAVFRWVLQQLAESSLVTGKTLGIDATTLEANAALRSIVRRDTGEDYTAFLTRLAQASGVETPTAEELARFDRERKKKKTAKTSNRDWTHPHDPDAKVAKMKDGSTHLAHKVEHAVDLETGAVVGVTVQGADQGDTTTLVETLVTSAEQVEAVLPDAAGVAEVVADKGYHSNATLVGLAAAGVRSYIAEPERGRRNWKGRKEARAAVYGNRRRLRGQRGRRLQRRRGERVERPFAHLYETGGMRRVHLRGHPNILKRLADRRWHAPGPAGPGRSRRLGADRAAGGPVERSEAALDAMSAPCGADRRAIAPPAPSTSHLKTEDFYLGLIGRAGPQRPAAIRGAVCGQAAGRRSQHPVCWSCQAAGSRERNSRSRARSRARAVSLSLRAVATASSGSKVVPGFEAGGGVGQRLEPLVGP